MDNNSVTIETLVTLADEVLASGNSPDTIIKLETYATSFNAWYTAYENSVKLNKPINSKEELELLLTKHEKVTALSESLKDAAPEEMTKFKKKSKGIMAYIDTLPKKISFTKPKKG